MLLPTYFFHFFLLAPRLPVSDWGQLRLVCRSLLLLRRLILPAVAFHQHWLTDWLTGSALQPITFKGFSPDRELRWQSKGVEKYIRRVTEYLLDLCFIESSSHPTGQQGRYSPMAGITFLKCVKGQTGTNFFSHSRIVSDITTEVCMLQICSNTSTPLHWGSNSPPPPVLYQI